MRYLLLFLILLPSVIALTPIESGTMEARVLITNEITFRAENTNFDVDEATGTLSWFPRDDTLQDVISFEMTPLAERTADAVIFKWDNPDRTEELSIQSNIKTRNSIIPVRKRIPFPLSSVPPDVSQYLGNEEIIDQSPEIQRLAQELAAGKNDAYEVIFSLADWTTTNVDYSLESLGAPAIQRSSQVLDSRWGKCDELTALFISLNRALGIPARFVAGYSYTNSDLIQTEWGGHGWAEVWLPNVGWIPFDVTYGEYGYLDASHVKLKISEDAKETSIDFRARGSDFYLETEPLDIFITPTLLQEHSDERIEINLGAPHIDVGFGSAVLILATVTNKKDYYVSTRLDLAQTTNTEMLSDNYQNVLLRPYQTRTLPFLVKIDENLDSKFRYEFPFRMSSRLGVEDSISINVHPNSKSYSEEEFQELIDKYEDEGIESAPFTVTCERGDPAYVGDTSTQQCTVSGAIGETLEICADTCETKQVSNSKFPITHTFSTPGIHTTRYEAKWNEKSTMFFVTTRVVTPTTLNATFDHPATAKMADRIAINIFLDHTGALPENLDIGMKVNHATATQHLKDLSVPADLFFHLPGNSLRSGENGITLVVEYEDELGTPGNYIARSTITLTDANALHKIRFWFIDVSEWFEGIFS